jgi:NAD-dependent deacetylase
MATKELQNVTKKKLVVLSGAGVSAESGLATFRGSNGLWEGYKIMEVASPEGWAKDYRTVLEFYNARRRNIASVLPNEAHKLLAEMEKEWEVSVITQNIDNLHEQAGSTQVIHLHGEITKACSSNQKRHVIDMGFGDILEGDVCEEGYQMRPFIVWFGEAVPLIESATEEVLDADVVLVIGTSLEVYPAAGLVNFARPEVPIYVIDPNPVTRKMQVTNKVIHIQKGGSEGMKEFVVVLNNKSIE